MAGELFRASWQIGKESSWGSDAAATRKMYFRPDSKLTREREPRLHKFAVGTRDNIRAVTLGPEKVGGSVSVPMSAQEILELLLMTIKGSVSPAGSGLAKLWTFTPDPTLDSATIEWDDGARVWQMVGAYGDGLKIAGNANGENIVTADLIGKAITIAALTGGMVDRIPQFFEGWEAKLYIDAFGGTAGSSNSAGILINWDVAIKNNYARKYFADNTLAGSLAIGELAVEATLTFEAIAAAATEFSNWDAVTKRLLRLEFGNNTNFAVNEIQTITITGTPTGGDFTLTFGGQTTAAIAFNAAAADVLSALEALSTIDPGDIVCAGGALPGTGVTVTFSGGTKANTDAEAITANSAGLTGGTTPTVVITETVKGGNQKEYVKLDLPGAWTAFELGGEDNGTRTYQLKLNTVYDTVNAFGLRFLVNTTRGTAF